MDTQTIAGYVGLVGGTIAIVRSSRDLVDWIKNFRTINIEVLRIMYFVDRFTEYEVERAKGPYPTWKPHGLIGAIHEALTIIEFQLQNTTKKTVCVRLMEIDDWIWSDRYTPPMYGLPRDYRVFDLNSKDNVSLADTLILEPGDIVGRRIEIAEKGTGPSFVSSHNPMSVPEKDTHVLTVKVGRRQIQKRIHLPKPTEYSYQQIDVQLWSKEELPVIAHYPSSAGAARP